MEEKITYLPNDKDVEKKVQDMFDELDVEETESLLKNYDFEGVPLTLEYVKSIKEIVSAKAGIEKPQTEPEQLGVPIEQKRKDNQKVLDFHKKNKPNQWRACAAFAALFLLAIFAWKNSDSMVLAFNRMFGLIPGVGIVEDNKDILYQLKSPESAETDQGVLSILSVVATKDTMTVNFSFERKNYTEEQLKKDKQEEWERLKKEDRLEDLEIYLIIDNVKYTMSGGSNGGGLTENFSATFNLKEELINTSKNYTIAYEKFGTNADFQLITLEQFSSLDEIGATNIHNNISLTAASTVEKDQLKVNVYPINYSEYNLISFEQDYSSEYFGKKIVLETENGDKAYTLPGSYGSGMNAAYSFDISDGSKELLLKIPFVVVESKEEEKLILPIPKVGEVIEVNKEIAFDKGSVIIKSVEKQMPEGGNEYGDLKMNLEYKSTEKNQQLVGIEFNRTSLGGWGYSGEYDKDGRLTTINFMLEKSDKNRIKLKAVKPRYVFMDEYNLTLDAK